MKVKLDDYDVRVLINGLYQQSRDYETANQIDDLLLRLVDLSDTMKPNRKKKIFFASEEIIVIRQCLMEWRNQEIQAERWGAVDGINELLVLFTR